MRIQVLNPDVVSQIAAGEVLDRPANLVKELVENSLDAGANEIDVEFGSSGRDVVVRDNGSGISQEDLPRALMAHATSKISCAGDLQNLTSFGFRGEALASIAAVSHLTLTARRKDEDQGYRLSCEFGQTGDPSPVAARVGCEVRVKQLFDNVPARLKFLRSEAAEHGQIKNVLKALALAHPDVAWSIRAKGSLLYHWPKAKSWMERAKLVLESDTLYFNESNRGGVGVQVLVGSPQDAAQVNRNMWFFAQDRWIQDRSLTAAVMEAYRNLLMHGEYPSVVIRLHVPPEDIDVNVHPTKSQVKFRDPQSVFRAVSHTIREVLEKAPWLGVEGPPPQSTAGREDSKSFKLSSPNQNLRFSGGEFERTQYNQKMFPLAAVREAVNSYSSSHASPPANFAGSEQVTSFKWADLQAIGQLNQTYIVAQSAEAFYLVDQHAAHERVVFERLMETFKNGKMEIQTLLLPLTMDIPESEVESLLSFKTQLESMGVSLERMGPESVAISAIPTLAKDSAIVASLKKLADDLAASRGEKAFERMIGDIFASMACHSVIRAGQPMSIPEMQSLLTQMDQYPLSSFCPHGRPVFVKQTFNEIEREFGRIV
jgi:DNA mismatch repair protein MutL